MQRVLQGLLVSGSVNLAYATDTCPGSEHDVCTATGSGCTWTDNEPTTGSCAKASDAEGEPTCDGSDKTACEAVTGCAFTLDAKVGACTSVDTTGDVDECL